jgi:hypothetical protein
MLRVCRAKTPQIIRAFDESESCRLPVGSNVAPVALGRALTLHPSFLGIAAVRDEHALGTVSWNSCSDLCHDRALLSPGMHKGGSFPLLSWWRPVGASAVDGFCLEAHA